MTARSRAWMDCETTGLHPDRRAYEVAVILRRPGGTDDEWSWFIDIEDCDMANAEPIALEVGGFWRRHPQAHLVPPVGNLADVVPDLPQTPPTAPVFREVDVLKIVSELTAGKAYIMGSNPAFDTQTLGARMAVYGITPGWHYHPIDVPDRAAGWLAGQGREVPTNEKGDEKSDLIAKACGADPADYERHSALGDCRLFRDLWDAIQPVAARKASHPEGWCHRDLGELIAEESARNPEFARGVRAAEHIVGTRRYGIPAGMHARRDHVAAEVGRVLAQLPEAIREQIDGESFELACADRVVDFYEPLITTPAPEVLSDVRALLDRLARTAVSDNLRRAAGDLLVRMGGEVSDAS